MVPIIVAVILYRFVLCVCLSDANAAVYGTSGTSGEGASGPIVIQEDQFGPGPGEEVIKGEVLRMESDHVLVKGNNGKEVRMHIDQTTRMSHKILHEGELIEATVNEKRHALSIKSPGRKSEHTVDPGQIMEPQRK